MFLTDFVEKISKIHRGGHNFVPPDATIEDKLGAKMWKTYAKKRKYSSQNSLFSIYISHFLSENYRF